MAYGKSIELFLANGTADSLITAELSNWNGKAIKIPRIEVAECNRTDIKGAGVYFLFCKENDSDSVYIGESEAVYDRLMQHIRDYGAEKEEFYWTTAVIFLGRDLNKALIRYLEDRFVQIARDCKRYKVLTKNTYSKTVMKESQTAAMEEFIDNVRILINTLGYKVLDPTVHAVDQTADDNSTAATENGTILYLDHKFKNSSKVKATGVQTSEGFVVYKGSQISSEEDGTIPETIKKKRKIAKKDDQWILQEDILFTSPSYAAIFVIGKSANGLTSWKDENGKTLKSLEAGETSTSNQTTDACPGIIA